MEILLLSEKLFRENSPIQDNTHLGKFILYIGLAQKTYLEPLLGRALIEELQRQVPPPLRRAAKAPSDH